VRGHLTYASCNELKSWSIGQSVIEHVTTMLLVLSSRIDSIHLLLIIATTRRYYDSNAKKCRITSAVLLCRWLSKHVAMLETDSCRIEIATCSCSSR